MSDTADTTEPTPVAPASEGDGWEWMIVEIMGHRKHAGRVREEERFGARMLRIDVPVKGDPATHGWLTHYYGGAAIFGVTFTDEATALRINKPYEAPGRFLPRFEEADDEEIDPDEGPF